MSALKSLSRLSVRCAKILVARAQLLHLALDQGRGRTAVMPDLQALQNFGALDQEIRIFAEESRNDFFQRFSIVTHPWSL